MKKKKSVRGKVEMTREEIERCVELLIARVWEEELLPMYKAAYAAQWEVY